MSERTLEQTIHESGVLRCLECGKCTAICPIARFDGGFSPRVTVGRALARHDEALLRDDRLWTCINCLQCNQVCPAAVDYSSLTTAVRVEARRLGQAALCTHGEAIHVWMRMMTRPDLKQNRLEWLSPDLKYQTLAPALRSGPYGSADVSNVNEPALHSPLSTLYFAGCAPHYDALFKPLGIQGSQVAQASVRILNELGVEPLLLADERCCGHDLLWEGDIDGFLKLAQLNAEMIRASGVKRIVSSCPECVRALKVDYPAHGVRLNAQVIHLSELLTDFKVKAKVKEKTVTFHDPCRLGRHLGIYDAPRKVLEGLGYKVVEMRHARRNATCCGTNGWTHCDAANKAIQVQRLREAKATGAEVMVTACLKCQIHFKCALMDERLKSEVGIEMVDLATLVAERLG
jgi:Fe-S oxidoreductase